MELNITTSYPGKQRKTSEETVLNSDLQVNMKVYFYSPRALYSGKKFKKGIQK